MQLRLERVRCGRGWKVFRLPREAGRPPISSDTSQMRATPTGISHCQRAACFDRGTCHSSAKLPVLPIAAHSYIACPCNAVLSLASRTTSTDSRNMLMDGNWPSSAHQPSMCGVWGQHSEPVADSLQCIRLMQALNLDHERPSEALQQHAHQ
jgi:hypothetical protein